LFSNSFEGVLGVVRKSREAGVLYFRVSLFLYSQFVEVFWGGAWGAHSSPSVYLWIKILKVIKISNVHFIFNTSFNVPNLFNTRWGYPCLAWVDQPPPPFPVSQPAFKFKRFVDLIKSICCSFFFLFWQHLNLRGLVFNFINKN